MSYPPQHPGQLTFYLTRPAPCPYLQGQVEQKIFTRLSGEPKSDFFLNSSMNQHGFRRSQSMVYRPACPACMACVPVRINLAAYAADRRLRRVARRNADLTPRLLPVSEALRFCRLFFAYQQARHAESDMAAMSEADYLAMMQDGGANAALLTLAGPSGDTLAAMLVDRLHHGYSAVYSFYSPQEEKRSLGTALILALLAQADAEKLPYVYLGYWVKNSPKMAYKSGFPGLERLGAAGWEPMPPSTGNNSQD